MGDKFNRILIVDDNQDIHEDIRNILNSAIYSFDQLETQLLKDELFGNEVELSTVEHDRASVVYTIDSAYQGEDAIAMVQKALDEGEPYSLIFMDARMPPGMDGIQATKEIWAIDPNVETVICTAYSDYSWEQILTNLGQNDRLFFIKKPFDHISIKQLALSLTTKWNLQRLNKEYIENLELEVERRTQDLKATVEKLTGEVSLRKQKEEELAFNAHYDSLTGLLNRSSFYSSMTNIVEKNNQDERMEPFSVFFIDIDGFKKVNDVLGHDVGDLLLVEISQRIQHVLKAYAFSIPEFSLDNKIPSAIFRLGGDEITAIINTGDKDAISGIANLVIDSMKRVFFIMNHEVRISCSIGISLYPEDSNKHDSLLKFADIAMYRAKESKGLYVFYEKHRDSVFLQKLKIENDLTDALNRKQINLYYQALVNSDNSLIGIEALVRWYHPEFGVLKPDEFIHIAEKSNQMLNIGEYILKTACRDLKVLHSAGYDQLFVIVNCTTKQLFDPNLINIINSALSEFELDPKYIKLGLAGKTIIQNEDTMAVIEKLRNMGIQITIDGFESANSMLRFLQQVPRNTIIRLDKKYIENIVCSSELKYLLVVLDIIKSWNLNAIITGIETPDQKKILNDKDCILQGFYFNIPKPFDDFLKELETKKFL